MEISTLKIKVEKWKKNKKTSAKQYFLSCEPVCKNYAAQLTNYLEENNHINCSRH